MQSTVENVRKQASEKVVAKGEEYMEMAQETLHDLISHAPKYAKTYSSRAVKWAKANPVQAGIAGAVIALFFGRKIFGSKHA